MKELPILMNEDMVGAILDGRKTQTRRPVKPQPPKIGGLYYAEIAPALWRGYLQMAMAEPASVPELKSPYRVGDHLWVRETFACTYPASFQDGAWSSDTCHPIYRADYEPNEAVKHRWSPSIHMPRWASRITLEITDVRAQWLGEITTDDLAAEGFRHTIGYGPLWFEDWRETWDGIYASRGLGWDDNPLVWRITFGRVEEAAS